MFPHAIVPIKSGEDILLLLGSLDMNYERELIEEMRKKLTPMMIL